MPKSLHAELVALAEAEGVSLNQLAVSALARMAARAAEDKAPRAESVSPYEAIDRLDHTEQLLQLLLSRFQELNGERLPELEEVVHDLEDELADAVAWPGAGEARRFPYAAPDRRVFVLCASIPHIDRRQCDSKPSRNRCPVANTGFLWSKEELDDHRGTEFPGSVNLVFLGKSPRVQFSD